MTDSAGDASASHSFDLIDICSRCGTSRIDAYNKGIFCEPAPRIKVADDVDAIRAARDKIRADEAEARRFADQQDL